MSLTFSKSKAISIVCVLAIFMCLACSLPAQADAGRLLYKVKQGDTLSSLAESCFADKALVAAMNNLDENATLAVGKVLYLPKDPEVTVQVQKGQTLWAIAKKYNTTVDTLAAYNELKNPNQLKVGQSISIPAINVHEEPNGIAVRAVASRMGVLQRNSVKNSNEETIVPTNIKWLCPLRGPITSDFGKRGSGFHHGVDIGAEEGTKAYGVAAGTVSFSGWKNNIYGYMVILDHGNGWTTLYAHAKKVLVKEGQKVKAGQAVIRVGQTGKTTGPHLHIEIHQGNTVLNPHKYIPFKKN